MADKRSQAKLLEIAPATAPLAAIDRAAARRLRLARLSTRIADSLDKLVRAEERARTRLGHPVWTDRLRTR